MWRMPAPFGGKAARANRITIPLVHSQCAAHPKSRRHTHSPRQTPWLVCGRPRGLQTSPPSWAPSNYAALHGKKRDFWRKYGGLRGGDS